MNWLATSAPDWSRVLAFLLDTAIKGGAVILIALVVTWLLRRGSAAARHTVWSAAIAAQLVIPMLGLMVPEWRVGLVDEPAWVAGNVPAAPPVSGGTAGNAATKPTATPSQTIRVEDAPTTGGTKGPSVSAPKDATAPTTTTTTSRPSPLVLLTAIWMLGCIAVLGRLAAGTAVVSRMAQRGERVTDEKWLGLMTRLAVGLGIDRPLTLLRGDTLGVPVTWGIVYPVVFLPQDANSWPEERRRYVLVHEMAHVKRLDAFTQLVAQFALAIFWFNPLVWLAASRMRRERENACDDYVLTHGTKPSEYASDLLEIVRSIGTRNHRAAEPAFAALAMARRSEFEGRMLSILDPETPRTSLSRRGVVMTLITAIIVVAPLAAFSPFSPAKAHVGDGIPDSFKVSITGPNTKQAPLSPSFPAAPASAAAQLPPVAPVSRGKQATGAMIASFSASLVVPLLAGSAVDPCDKLGGLSGNSTSIHDDSDSPDARSIQFVRKSPSRCVEAILIGRIAFADNEQDIASMGRMAHARFRELLPSLDREVILTSDGGEPKRDYLVNGKSAAFDDAARTWFGTMLVTMLRESGMNAAERVRRLQKEGGTNRVLSEIDSIASSGAKRAYYETLLDVNKGMSAADLALVVSRVKRDLGSSSGDLRSVLERVGRLNTQSTQSSQVRTALADAITSISSDGDKTSVLTALVWTADRNMLVEFARVAKTISSDGDKSNFLITAASRFLTGRDAALRNGYFDCAGTINSDGDRQRVYVSAVQYGHGDEAVTLGIINGTLTMSSSGDKAVVLVSVANQRLLTTDKMTSAYMDAAKKIDSEGDRERVIRAAVKP
jgi:beta-lactamase regulating signal transducer with metallopeptidase domain